MTTRLEWRPAQHNQITLPQLDSEVVNPTGLAENKGLIVSNGKRIVCSKKTGKQENSRLYSSNKEKDRGPQFTRGVSPQDNTVLGKQITAGQLTHENAHKDANTRQDEYYEIYWALQQRSQTAIQLHL